MASALVGSSRGETTTVSQSTKGPLRGYNHGLGCCHMVMALHCYVSAKIKMKH